MKKHYKSYSKLRRKYENGRPVLNHYKIAIMRLRREDNDVILAFDSQNEFNFIRYEVLDKYPKLSEFKKITDQKISRPEQFEI